MEKDRWIATLEELQKAAKQSPNQMSPVFGCREMYTTQQLEILRNCISADVADSSEFFLLTLKKRPAKFNIGVPEHALGWILGSNFNVNFIEWEIL